MIIYLGRYAQAPTVPPVWENEFADPVLPLHVDIGCGM